MNTDNATDQFERNLSVKSRKPGFKTSMRHAAVKVYPPFTFHNEPELQWYTFCTANEDGGMGCRN